MKRSTLVLGGVFVVLLAIAFVVLQKPGEQSRSSAAAGTLLRIDSVAVDRIELRNPSSRIVLEKKGAEWYVTQPLSAHADQTAVASLIGVCRELRSLGVVSGRPDKHGVFQVDSTGTRVTVYEKGAETASFIVGKAGSTYADTYLRLAHSNDVLQVSGLPGDRINRPLRDWRDRTITRVPRETIRQISYQYGDTTFVVALKDSVWMIGRDKVQPSIINGLLGTLSSLQADDFADSVAVAPRVTAQITFGGEQVRFAYRKETGKYLVQDSSSPQWFVLESWRANDVLKRKKDLLGIAR